MTRVRLWTRRGAALSLAGVGAAASALAGTGNARAIPAGGPEQFISSLLNDFLHAGDVGESDRQARALAADARLLIVNHLGNCRVEGAHRIASVWRRARAERSMAHFVTTLSVQPALACAECYLMESVYADDRRLLLGQAHYRVHVAVGPGGPGWLLQKIEAELLWSSGQSMHWPVSSAG